MLKIFQTLCLLFLVTALFAQDRSVVTKKVGIQKLDNCETVINSFQPLFNHPTLHNRFAPAGTVPFPINYNDYATNGNNMRKLFVLGDTVVVAQDINGDNTNPPPPIVYPSRVQYNVSYNGGLTWLTDALNTGGSTANRWPNIFPIYVSGLRTLISTGRLYITNTSTAGQGTAFVEQLLGLGSFNFYSLPTRFYRDYFGYIKNSTTIGGVIPAGTGAATDSLFYAEFNFVTNTFSTPVLIAPAMNTSYRTYSAISSDGQRVFAAWHDQVAYVLNAYESTNGGASFTGPIAVGPATQDSAWLMADVVYKPNSTQRCMAYSTLGSYDGYRSRSKILFWSPTINGGNPTVIADFTKYPFMLDSVAFFTAFDNTTDVQYSFRPFSVPSLSWSDDGTVLYCAFNAVQPDTSTYSTGTNYHFQDILISKSLDNGATWSPLRYVTHTAKVDELYPSVSKTGNTSTTFNITWNQSNSPGSYTFTQNAPIDTTYTIFKKLVFSDLPPVGITNISSQVPTSYSLMQNYPNPFNPTTTIRFTLPKASLVTIKVYNIAGQLVEILANNESASIGTKEVKFSGENLSSGIYFYTLEAGNFKETKKMMLIK
jgi:hypothetical protein